jgi:hypothetical protein
MAPTPDIESAEPSELIYVPGSSWAPAVVAVGITLIMLGMFKGWSLWVIGAVVLLLGMRSWWRQADDEIASMRREQRRDTAVIPAEPVRRRR